MLSKKEDFTTAIKEGNQCDKDVPVRYSSSRKLQSSKPKQLEVQDKH